MTVALVLVSHSADLARGVCELAGQMAPDVCVLPAGGMPGGALGTSLETVTHAVEQALAGADGVVVLADLGSAVLTVEAAIEIEDDWSARVVLADAPFVEGAVAAAVVAQQGGSLAGVREAAEEAGGAFAGSVQGVPDTAASGPGRARAQVTVRNPLGLHARPAARLARLVADLGVPVRVGGADGSSVLQVLALGAQGGTELEVAADGPRAHDAVTAVVELIESGFGEV